MNDSARILYRVEHETRTRYQRAVALSQQVLHLAPRGSGFQETLSHNIEVLPAPSEMVGSVDYFGNAVSHLTVTERHQDLVVRAHSVVSLAKRPDALQLAGSMPWEELRNLLSARPASLPHKPWEFLYESPHVQCAAELAAYAATSFTPGRPVLEAALDLTQRISRDFEFDAHATTISTPLAEVISGRRGVCQDFAHLMIGCLRSLGLPARYVSGYLLTTPPPGQKRLLGADASHAWVSAYCPRLGWIDFDPTNSALVQSAHVTLGWGRDFSDVTPMRGIVLGGGQQELQVRVSVIPLAP